MSYYNKKKKVALVFGNGTYEDSAFYLKVINENPDAFILAVDGGFNFLINNGITPDLLIGDLDSIKEEYEGIEVIQVKPEKDETDTRLALNYLLQKGYYDVILLGMLSLDRIDHSLANILILIPYINENMKIKIENYYNEIILLKGPTHFNIINQLNKTLSLIPLTPTVKHLYIQGVKYPLENKNMNYFDADLTVSNEIISKVCIISLEKGIILVDLINHEK